MGKKEIKKQHKNLDISVIDYLSRFDPTDTNKLTGFLVKMFENRVSGEKHMSNNWMMDHFQPKNRFDDIMGDILVDFLGGRENIETLEQFSEHLEAGRIKNNDIGTYNTWDAVRSATSDAQIKFMDKEMKKQINVLFDDKTWLIMKPLSLKAAQTYGLGTRWCTSMKTEPSYFYDYSNRGILIYCINKVNGKKFGFFSSDNEFSVWDAIDNRIDSMETRLPSEIISIIRKESDLNVVPTNKGLFSEESLKQYEDFYNRNNIKNGSILNTIGNTIGNTVMEQPVMDEYIALGNPLNDEFELVEESMEPVMDDVSTHNQHEEEDWLPRGANVAFGGGIQAVPHLMNDMDVDMGVENIGEVMMDMSDAMEAPTEYPQQEN